MRVPIVWLKEYVDLDIPAEKLADLLTMAGLEVSSIESHGGDVSVVLDIAVLPNRGDALSIIGIAREVAALLGKPLKKPKINVVAVESSERVTVTVLDPDLCPRYMARLINGVKIAASPDWLKNRLLAAGVRPINNIVDITNYLLFETGQPLHAFDWDKLAGKKIVVRRVRKGEKIETLDGVKRKLPEGVLCIADKDRPVAVAGVMGSTNSEVTEATQNILLESACFNPASIYRTAQQLKLRSESSMRFERGVDWDGVEYALDRAAELMATLGGGKVTKDKIDVKKEARKAKQVVLRPDRVRKILGVNISDAEIIKLLVSLGFTVEPQANNFTVLVPLFRYGDIEREIDLIEEVGRIYGYEKIPSTIPACADVDFIPAEKQTLADQVRDILTGYGLQETLTFSIVDPAVFKNFPAPLPPAITNPLSEENSVLRTSLLPYLLQVVSHNQRHQIGDVCIFEVGTVFTPQGKEIVEETRVGGAMVGSFLRGNWTEGGKAAEANFFTIKGIVEALVEEITGLLPEIVSANVAALAPGRAAEIKIDGKVAGYLGELKHPIRKAFDLTQPVFIFDIALAPLLENVKQSPRYQALPKFPAVTRDIALTVPNGVAFGDIERIIKASGSPILEEAVLFDRYSGKPIPEGYYSLAFSLRYRDPQRTLTDDVVNKNITEILATLDKELGVKLR